MYIVGKGILAGHLKKYIQTKLPIWEISGKSLLTHFLTFSVCILFSFVYCSFSRICVISFWIIFLNTTYTYTHLSNHIHFFTDDVSVYIHHMNILFLVKYPTLLSVILISFWCIVFHLHIIWLNLIPIIPSWIDGK